VCGCTFPQCIQLALHRWAELPPLACGDLAHLGLLRLFHRLVEAHESGSVLHAINAAVTSGVSGGSGCGGGGIGGVGGSGGGGASASRVPGLQGLRELIKQWRLRLPNAWESVGEWDELLSWRQWVFKAASDAVKRNPSLEVSESPRGTPLCPRCFILSLTSKILRRSCCH